MQDLYLSVILCAIVLQYALELAADLLNLRRISPEIPAEFSGVYDPDTYRKSQQYLKTNTRFSVIYDTVYTTALVLFILGGGFAWADHAARGLELGSIGTGLVFAGICAGLSYLLQLPFSAWRTFVIEERFGFNKTTPAVFATDRIKTLLLGAMLGGAAFAMVQWFFEKTGTNGWLYGWAALTAFQLAVLFLAPVLILPLFNKFKPLEAGPLKDAIQSYARAQKFRMRGVFTMDGSKRSNKSNAFFTGFGRFRRIVLFDTLISRHSTEEIIAVLAHEMGHYKRRHIRNHVLMSTASSGMMFFLLSLLIGNADLARAFGVENPAVYSSLVFFAFLYAPVEMLLGIVTKGLSRRYEFQADAYAYESSRNLDAVVSLLKKLSRDNLSNLTPHPFKVFLNYTHPPALRRIEALRALAAKTPAVS